MSTSSGIGHDSTAFVGCDHGKVTKILYTYFRVCMLEIYRLRIFQHEFHSFLKFVLNWEYQCWLSSRESKVNSE